LQYADVGFLFQVAKAPEVDAHLFLDRGRATPVAWCYKMSSALRVPVHSQPKFTENTTIIRLQNYTLFKNQWIVYATITVCWREIVTDTESLALK
jgi:hypothetical protein